MQSIYILEFGHRLEKVVHEIEQSGSDVIALQEVDHADIYKSALEKLHYQVVLSPRGQDIYETGLIAFRKGMFTLEHVEHLDYRKHLPELHTQKKGFQYKY